ncbi:hypothetical protein ACO9S2_05015 [Nitrospira sp. NS4]|uniref:hypothetical protein n=1 Tax=Nitrospira sp. NS4 TaxID=3414498 RepID=UPI003C2BF222
MSLNSWLKANVNRLMCSGVSFLGAKNKGERGLSVITQLRDSYQKPVIALMGWYPEDGSWSEENLKQAGACASFVIPPDGAPFINAVSECLEKGGTHGA